MQGFIHSYGVSSLTIWRTLLFMGTVTGDSVEKSVTAMPNYWHVAEEARTNKRN